MPRKIAVITGSRAEFGLLKSTLAHLRDGGAELQIIATGGHLLPSQGLTVRTLHQEGFPPTLELDMVVGGDTRRAMAKSLGLGVLGFADAFNMLQPDAILLLGDRYEILAAANAALMIDIPIIHVEGGHVTEGAVDDSIRHAVTKMARLHFTSCQDYAQRLIRMGEAAETVHVVGSPGIDNVLSLPLLSRTELEADLGIDLASPLFMVTLHSETAGQASSDMLVTDLIRSLDQFPDASIIISGANADPGGELINSRLLKFSQEKPARRKFVHSLGVLRYLSVSALSQVIIGNSSSGLVEGPSLGVPTVNIGDRQKGRIRAPSIIDCEKSAAAITAAINLALTEEKQRLARKKINPMGDGTAAPRIARIILEQNFKELPPKKFFDGP